jgi:hypothetical protein
VEKTSKNGKHGRESRRTVKSSTRSESNRASDTNENKFDLEPESSSEKGSRHSEHLSNLDLDLKLNFRRVVNDSVNYVVDSSAAQRHKTHTSHRNKNKKHKKAKKKKRKKSSKKLKHQVLVLDPDLDEEADVTASDASIAGSTPSPPRH